MNKHYYAALTIVMLGFAHSPIAAMDSSYYRIRAAGMMILGETVGEAVFGRLTAGERLAGDPQFLEQCVQQYEQNAQRAREEFVRNDHEIRALQKSVVTNAMVVKRLVKEKLNNYRLDHIKNSMLDYLGTSKEQLRPTIQSTIWSKRISRDSAQEVLMRNEEGVIQLRRGIANIDNQKRQARRDRDAFVGVVLTGGGLAIAYATFMNPRLGQ